MRNKIAALIYFICLTILFSNSTRVFGLEKELNTQNLQISASFIDNSTSDIEKLFRNNLNLGDCILYSTVPRGLIVSINSIVFFDDGKDEIKECSKEILNRIAQILKFIQNPCVIEGNTTKDTYTTSIYRSDWEISMVRAERIADYLIKAGNLNHNQIRAIGFGEMMPFADNVSSEGNLNQRIDFVILNYGGGSGK